MHHRFLSPAKVNLFLKILARRPDGYHEIYSLMQPVSIHDDIAIECGAGSGITVRCTGDTEAPDGKANLAYRAAELFVERTGVNAAVDIAIAKKIPVGAGLGGGSSNAATVIMALNELLGQGLPDEELSGMAASLGSDVPFFLMKGPAIATGRGEVLERAMLPETHYVLVNPGFHVSTAWAYGNLDLTKRDEDNILSYSDGSVTDAAGLVDYLVNDLEAVTIAMHPEIGELKARLVEAGALGALMSGSGPTVFGLFADEESAKVAGEMLASSLGEKARVFAVKGL